MNEITAALYALIATLITAFAGLLGVVVKRLGEKYINTKIKKDVARTVVSAVEQIYKDLHGEEKFSKAREALEDMLAEKGIVITDLELQMLIESAVSEFNKSFVGNSNADEPKGEDQG
ncbi:MAG: hypothetical protein IJS45_07475 [Clostridia bacterium]|nr:hypothetical protein [Clostridia bacterium]